MASERLQKIMASAGVGSRRQNEKLIAQGRVTVNGALAHLGDKADPAIDRIEVNGKIIRPKSPIYIKLNKPKGVLSSTEDELNQNRLTVRDLVPIEGHLFPIGRLDKQSEGLIILSNDGPLCHRLTHPRYEHKKIYSVTLSGEIADADIDEWRRGVVLDGKQTAPAEIEIINRDQDVSQLLIALHEGKKRQIRRIASDFGHPVIKLVRLQIGPIRLGALKTGQWAFLSKNEIKKLRRLAKNSLRKGNVIDNS